MDNKDIKKLIDSLLLNPAFLFVGQDFLKIDESNDLFLNRIVEKYLDQDANDIPYTYDKLFEIGLKDDSERYLSWMAKLAKKLTAPASFEFVAKIPWSVIYTTNVNNILERKLSNDWRIPNSVYDNNQNIYGTRNRNQPHLFHLYGSVSQVDREKRLPFSHLEKLDRTGSAAKRLNELIELLTPAGKLCIEGYDPLSDWLEDRDIYGTLNRLGREQIYFFSFREEYAQSVIISDLINSGKIITTEESLGRILYQEKDYLYQSIEDYQGEEQHGRWIRIGNRKLKIPRSLKNQVRKSATILDENLLLSKEKETNRQERYRDFKKFLASPNNFPDWKAFSNGFAFERDFSIILYESIQKLINKNLQTDRPIIIHGQSSSGKTIGLANIGYKLAIQDKYPVLFISRSYQAIDKYDIDSYCEWAEENGANFTIIIWDGMVDYEKYYRLLNTLNARGRKVIIVGSSYTLDDETLHNDWIEVEIELSKNEQDRFGEYLSKNLPNQPLLNQIIKQSGEKNFLALLYRYLPSAKPNISDGLNEEVSYFSKYIIENATQEINETHETRLAQLLIEAGLTGSNGDKRNFQYGGDSFNVKEAFVNLIIVPGKFGLTVPFDLLIRCVGTDKINQSILKLIRKTDIISWHEDQSGNIYLSPRTSIESRILVKALGSIKSEVEIISDLLSNIVYKSHFGDYNSQSIEIDFAVELLRLIGPNSKEPYPEDYWVDIADTLEDLRISNQAHHPRLVLQEATFLREAAVKFDNEHSEELINRAEEILEDEIESSPNIDRESKLFVYLKVELASIVGTRLVNWLNSETGKKPETSTVLENYEFSKQQLLDVKKLSPENYYSLDVFLWTSRTIIESNILNNEKLLEVESDVWHIIDFSEYEGINESYKDKFLKRKLEISDALEKIEISEKTFEELIKRGSASGVLLKARKHLQSIININSNEPLTEKQLVALKEAYTKLKRYQHLVNNDSKAIYFQFRLWWLINAKSPLFYKERNSVPFTSEQWIECLDYVERLKNLDKVYYTPTLMYVEALSLFHIEEFEKSLETFEELSRLSDYSVIYGSRRIQKHHLASSESGDVLTYTGEVVLSSSVKEGHHKCLAYISDIRKKLPFMLHDFSLKKVDKGEILTDVAIAFSFRGPILVPINNQ